MLSCVSGSRNIQMDKWEDAKNVGIKLHHMGMEHNECVLSTVIA